MGSEQHFALEEEEGGWLFDALLIGTASPSWVRGAKSSDG